MPTASEQAYGVGDASYRAAGGREGIEGLVDDFYRIMDEEAVARGIRRMHPPDLGIARDKLARFLSGWLNGPKRYAEKYGSISIPGAHARFPIGERERDAWLYCMERAIALQGYAPLFADYLLAQLSIPAQRILEIGRAGPRPTRRNAMTPAGFEIPKRFNGPPASGNGGYVCGLLAVHLGGTATVRLKRSPPLETPLDLTDTADGADLSCEGVVVASARRSSLDLAAPGSPGFAAAESASARFKGFEQHCFPHCFVCGPKRAAGDGLRIFPGALGAGDFAAPWVPDPSLAGPTGDVAPEFLWAALDCPGAFVFQPPEGRGVLLGELTAHIDGAVAVGERCVLLSRELAHEGRKHFTASFLFGEDDELRAVARGTWIETV